MHVRRICLAGLIGGLVGLSAGGQPPAGGTDALIIVTIGEDNTAFGHEALSTNEGDRNTAVRHFSAVQNRGECCTSQDSEVFGLVDAQRELESQPVRGGRKRRECPR